jgi:Tol biopolymer transport system component
MNPGITRFTTAGNVSLATISPDGRYVAYVMQEGTKQSLWMRQVAAASAVLVVPPAAERIQGVRFAPDGNFLDYLAVGLNSAHGTLYQVPVLGGAAREVATPVDAGIGFSPDGKHIVYVVTDFDSFTSHLVIANTDGASPKQLASRKFSKTIGAFLSAAWSPDAKRIVAVATDVDPMGQNLRLLDLSATDGTERPFNTPRWRFFSDLAWLPDGSGLLLAAQERTGVPVQVWVIPYPGGTPRRITNDLIGYRAVTSTADGKTLAVVQADQISNLWVGPASKPDAAHQITNGRNDGINALASGSDGQAVYSSNANNNWDLSTVSLNGGAARQLTTDARYHGNTAVCGASVIYASDFTGTMHLYRLEMNNRNVTQLTNGAGEDWPSCDAAGRWLVFSKNEPDGSAHVAKMPAAGGEIQTLSKRLDAGSPVISPDGTRAADPYFRKDGNIGVVVVTIDGAKEVADIPAPPTVDPNAHTLAWMPDGKALAWVDVRSGTSNIWATPTTGGAPYQVTHFTSDQIWRFAFSPDGKSIVISRGPNTSDVLLLSNTK